MTHLYAYADAEQIFCGSQAAVSADTLRRLGDLQVWQPDGQYSHVAVTSGNVAFTFWLSFGKDKPTGAKARCHTCQCGSPLSLQRTCQHHQRGRCLRLDSALQTFFLLQGQLFGLALLGVRGDGKVQRLIEFRQLTSIEEAELVKEPYQSHRWDE